MPETAMNGKQVGIAQFRPDPLDKVMQVHLVL